MAQGELSILDALENLNTLVDAESLNEIEVTNEALLVAHGREVEEPEEDSYWVQATADEQLFDAIEKTFRSVNHYLQTFYQKARGTGDTKRLVEGINTVMVLVGEAAKKLERFGTLFKDRVSELSEYKKLQDFYRNKVIQESFREFAKISIPKSKKLEREVLPEAEHVEEVEGVHILNDIEVIKRDHLYELFYIRNEAGHPFYTPSLARNIKLSCDFGEFAGEYFGEDPLLQLKNWEDKSLHILANRILKSSKHLIEKFYKEAMKYKGVEAVSLLNKSLMALMLASNSRNLIRQFSLKGCHLYFSDFIFFLREVLHNRDYQKMLVYASTEDKPIFHDLINLVSELVYGFFTLGGMRDELQRAIKQLVEREGKKERRKLSDSLKLAEDGLRSALKKHPNGPIFKAVDIVREEGVSIFDPLKQGNIPESECLLEAGEREILLIRVPTPIQQEFIHRAMITEEFKAYLHTLRMKKERHLFVNFQDRTSWKEHARCSALEELARHAGYADTFTVVTLAMDTDFYHQIDIYEKQDDAGVFIDQFLLHLQEENTGYYFPSHLKKKLFPDFASSLLDRIHTIFFDGKNTLSQKQRCDFIQLAYHFIELKLVEILEPTLLSLISKDGLDIGGVCNVGLIALLSMTQNKKWSEGELDRLMTICFGPTLMNRERVVHPERMQGLISIINLMEQREDYLKGFAPLYNKETLGFKPKL